MQTEDNLPDPKIPAAPKKRKRNSREARAFRRSGAVGPYRGEYDEDDEVTRDAPPPEAPKSANGRRQPSWRDTIAIHPEAEKYPLMAPDELRQLGDDIKANGLQVPVVILHTGSRSPADLKDRTKWALIDGRNRLDAMERVGIQFKLVLKKGARDWGWILVSNDVLPGDVGHTLVETILGCECPRALVASLNVHRRHLTPKEKRACIAYQIKANPAKSDRQIADAVKVSPTTVGTVRAELEAKGDVSKLDTRSDTQGRKQPVKKRAAKGATANRKTAAAKTEEAEALAAREAKAQTLQDVGENSAGELARLNARVDELQNEKHRLEIKNIGLVSENDELRAAGSRPGGNLEHARRLYAEELRKLPQPERVKEIQNLCIAGNVDGLEPPAFLLRAQNGGDQTAPAAADPTIRTLPSI